MSRKSEYTEYGLRLNHWAIHEAARWAVNTTERIHELNQGAKQETVADQLLSDAIAACDKGKIESIELEKTSFVHPWDFTKWIVEQWIPKGEKTRIKKAPKGSIRDKQPI